MFFRERYPSWFRQKTAPIGSILAVDDDFAMRVILHNVFKRSFDITTVCNGIEALLWLKEGKNPDIIISDISMPELNGFDFLSSLSQSGLYNSTPLVILSGHDEGEINERMSDYLNPVTFIPKPFDPIKVHDYVVGMIQKSGRLVK